MSDELIGIDIEGLDLVMKALERVPLEVKNAAIDDVADYLLNVLRTYPAQKRVTRRQAYGQTFQSDKQRRFFFAALKSGEITVPHKRTQALRRNWKIIGKSEGAIIVNDTAYAKYVHGSEVGQQANMMRIIGWKTLPQIIRERAGRIQEKLQAAVKKGLKRAGL